jgi:hypothetical protein
MGQLCSQGIELPEDPEQKPNPNPNQTIPNQTKPKQTKPKPSPTLENKVVALYKFEARADDEISFEANDILIVVGKPESDWWEAVHEKTGKEGFIPSTYVEEQYTNPLLRYLWYHGDSNRNDTSQMMRSQETGSYMLRDSSKDADQYVLVVRSAERKIVNYRVIKNDTNQYYINSINTFDDIQSLTDYYSKNDGLQVRLKNPVNREKEEGRERDMWEIDRKTIQKTVLLGSGNFGEVFKAT